MIIVYINDALIGVVNTDDNDEALDWLCNQVDLQLDFDAFEWSEEDERFFYGTNTVDLMYAEFGYRLDLN